MSSLIKIHLNEQLLKSPSSLKGLFHSTPFSSHSAACICLARALRERRKPSDHLSNVLWIQMCCKIGAFRLERKD